PHRSSPSARDPTSRRRGWFWPPPSRTTAPGPARQRQRRAPRSSRQPRGSRQQRRPRGGEGSSFLRVPEKRLDLQLERPLLARAADDAGLEYDAPLAVHQHGGREAARAVSGRGPLFVGLERAKREAVLRQVRHDESL